MIRPRARHTLLLASLACITACTDADALSPQSPGADGGSADGPGETGGADAGDSAWASSTSGDAAGAESGGEASRGDTDADAESGESGGESGGSSSSGGEGSSGGEDSSGGQGESTTGTEPPENTGCEAPGNLTACDGDSPTPFQALGLGCGLPADQSVPIFDTVWSAPDPDSWRIARQFGTGVDPETGSPYWTAREGEQFLIISTGRLGEPDEEGVVRGVAGEHDGGVDNGNPNLRQLPAPMTPTRGSNGGAGGTPFLGCDAVGDCSDSLHQEWVQGGEDAHDLLWFQFATPVPGGTHGFSFDFAYFSAEFPEFVDTSFNDVFAVWSDSESYTGNLCFVADRPCTVSSLWPSAHGPGDPALDGTGFEPSGSTGWFQAKGAAVPGELLSLTFAVFDMGDTAYDTAVLLDNFSWDCEGCSPSEVEPCVGIDPV